MYVVRHTRRLIRLLPDQTISFVFPLASDETDPGLLDMPLFKVPRLRVACHVGFVYPSRVTVL